MSTVPTYVLRPSSAEAKALAALLANRQAMGFGKGDATEVAPDSRGTAGSTAADSYRRRGAGLSASRPTTPVIEAFRIRDDQGTT